MWASTHYRCIIVLQINGNNAYMVILSEVVSSNIKSDSKDGIYGFNQPNTSFVFTVTIY